MLSQQNSDGQFNFSFDETILSSSEHADLGDAIAHEKFILEGIDSYWDDLNSCLIVSRMVNDAVIKGMVNAVAQEAADKISSKDTQLSDLSERLRHYELCTARGNKLGTLSAQEKPKEPKNDLQPSFIDFHMEQNHLERLSCLKNVAGEQLQKLKMGIEYVKGSVARPAGLDSGTANLFACSLGKMEESLDSLTEAVGSIYHEIGGFLCMFSKSFSEQQWRWDFQKEVANVIVQHHIKGLLEEFDRKLFRERNIYITQTNSTKILDKLSSLRNELDVISKALLNSEPGYPMSQSSHESIEDLNDIDRNSCKVLGNHSSYSSHAQENGSGMIVKSEVSEFPLLSHLSKDELVSHFKSEMSTMKRNHELALHQKTEELFMAKRALLKEKSSVPSRKDKNFEFLKKRISDCAVMFDNVMQEMEKFTAAQDDYYRHCDFQDRYNNLVRENQHLRDLLSDKKRENRSLATQLFDAERQMSNHFSLEVKSLKKVQKLRETIEGMKIEADLRDEILKLVLQEAIVDIKSCMGAMDMEAKLDHEVYSIILQASMKDIMSSADVIVRKCHKERKILESSIMQRDEYVALEVQRTKKLKCDIESLSRLMKDMEKSKQDTMTNYLKQKEQFQVVQKELLTIKAKTSEQEILLAQNLKELELLSSKLKDSNDQALFYKEEMFKLEKTLDESFINLMEAGIQNEILHECGKQKQNKLDTFTLEHKRQEEVLKFVVFSLLNLSKAFEDFQSNAAENIERNIARLEKINYQKDSILRGAVCIHKEALRYKHILHTKSSNLQKAEIEVDLLGDEVDALLSVLVKVYIALDHYSPVLQHYPGVMEVLQLVRRELEGTAKQSTL